MIKLLTFRTALAVFILTLINSGNCQAETLLRFGVYTSDKPSVMVRQFVPLTNLVQKNLSQQLGDTTKIDFSVSKSYQSVIDQLAKGEIDFARLGPVSYVTAKRKNPGLQLLAMESNKGSKVFNGVFCVHNESPIKKVEDIRGKSFAFGNSLSTIGRYLAQDQLVKHGITVKDLEHFDYLDRHDAVGMAVATGQYDVGSLKEKTFKSLVSQG